MNGQALRGPKGEPVEFSGRLQTAANPSMWLFFKGVSHRIMMIFRSLRHRPARLTERGGARR